MAVDKKTYVYKTVDACEIKADVYSIPRERLQPVVLYIHGGALIAGGRGIAPNQETAVYLEAGYAVVSIDYRLAPETKLPDIIEDIRDAYQWIRRKGPDLFGADPDRIVVTGGSAGGYLTLMTGFCVSPRPKALISYYGYGDIVGDWYSKPSAFYRERQPIVTREQALESVGTEPISEAGGMKRGPFYLYCRQQGVWPDEVSGFVLEQEPEKFVPYCPDRNVTTDYPPTMLIHGDADTDVPCELSVRMAAALEEKGVEHELVVLPGVGHGLAGLDPDAQMGIFRRAAEFFDAHVGKEHPAKTPL